MSMCAQTCFRHCVLGLLIVPRTRNVMSLSDRKCQSKCKGAAAVNKQLELNKWYSNWGRVLGKVKSVKSRGVRRGGVTCQGVLLPDVSIGPLGG